MKDTFLLQEVIDDLVNTEKSLSSPLIKLNYFAKLIKNQKLIDYTENELQGYNANPELIPEYRRALGTLIVDLQTQFEKYLGNQLPISMIDDRYRSNF